MAWTISYTDVARKQLKKMNQSIAKNIMDYIDEKISMPDDPKQIGKALSHNKSGLWRYRVGDYRIICEIQNEKINILVLEIGRRSHIYD